MESILPAKPTVEIPKGETVEEVSMMDFENTKGSSSKARSSGGMGAAQGFFGGGADGDEDDEDEMGGAAGGQQFACNTH